MTIACFRCQGLYWGQPTVGFPIGDHVNVLSDYKKTWPAKCLKLLTCCYHYLIDMPIDFNKNCILPTLWKCLYVWHPSIFTNAGKNYSANRSHRQIAAKYPSAYSNHLEIHHFTVNTFYNHTWKSAYSNALMSQHVNFIKNNFSKIHCIFLRVQRTGSLTRTWPQVGKAILEKNVETNTSDSLSYLIHCVFFCN